MKRFLIASLIVFFLCSGVIGGNKIQAAEKYPVKPITFIVPIEGGGDHDIVMRPWAEKASALLGKPVVVVNKPGAAQTIGYRETYGTRPDGYTICANTSSIIFAKLQGLFPYDYHDFTLLCLQMWSYPVLLASTKSKRQFKTFQEVMTFAKANPGIVSLATSATGGPLWITSQFMQDSTGVKFNVIPQEGSGGLVLSQVLGGHTDLGLTFFPTAKPQIDAGNVRCLAVVGPERFTGKYNNIQTLKELGYDVSIAFLGGLIGPPKMPKDIIDKLVKIFEIVNNDAEIQKFWLARFYFPNFLPTDQYFSFCDKQREMYRKILDKAGLLKEK